MSNLVKGNEFYRYRTEEYKPKSHYDSGNVSFWGEIWFLVTSPYPFAGMMVIAVLKFVTGGAS